MEGYKIANFDKLAQTIEQMHKCLECPICLHTISNSVKSNCGHRFCHGCITQVTKKKQATCPVCNATLTRRKYFPDDHTVKYIEKVENIILAVAKDTGIDILTYTTASRNTRESYSMDAKIRKTPLKSDENEDKKISSSIEPVPGPSHNQHTARSRSNPTQQFDGARPSTSKQQPDFSLDDTLKIVTDTPINDPREQKFDNKNVDKINKDGRQAKESKKKQVFDLLSRSKRNRATKNTKKKTKGAYAPNYLNSMTQGLKLKTVHQRVREKCADKKLSESLESTKSSDDSEEDSNSSPQGSTHNEEDPEGTVHETSTSKINSRKDWSAAIEFGKEMRAKERKLKSLHISKNKSRLSDDSTESGSIRSRPIKGTRQRGADNGGENESNMFESIANNPADNHRPRENRSLPNNASTQENPREGTPRKNVGLASMSGNIPSTPESPLIALNEGELVRIKNLNNHQMRVIIGVTPEGDRQELNNQSTLADVATLKLPLKKRGSLFKTPPPNRSSDSPYVTPVKSRDDANTGDNLPGSCFVSNQLFTPTSAETDFPQETPKKRNESNDPVSTESPDLGLRATSSRANRLSLKKHDGSSNKSNECTTDIDNVQLLAIKRVLIEQMDENRQRASSESKDGHLEKDRQNNASHPRTDSRNSNVSLAVPQRKKTKFVKLGKLSKIKQRKKVVNFIYVGTTRYCKAKKSGAVRMSSDFAPPTDDSYDSWSCETAVENVSRDQPNVPVDSRSFASERNPTKRINLYNDGIPEASTSMDNASKEATAENKENMEKREIAELEKNDDSTRKNNSVVNSPTVLNVAAPSSIKILSPDNDSQFQLLSSDSTFSRCSQMGKIIQQLETPKPDSAKPETSFEPRSAQFEACSRKSDEVTPKNADSASSDGRKRKRSKTREPLLQRPGSSSDEENSMNEGASNSPKSVSRAPRGRKSEVRARENLKKPTNLEFNKAKKLRDHEVVADKETLMPRANMNDENMIIGLQTLASKQHQMIITSSSGSDTDATEIILRSACSYSPQPCSAGSKRKRNISTDSDDAVVAKKVLNKWCEDIASSGGLKKRGKIEETLDSGKTSNSIKASEEERRDDLLRLRKSPSLNLPATSSHREDNLSMIDIFESENINTQRSKILVELEKKAAFEKRRTFIEKVGARKFHYVESSGSGNKSKGADEKENNATEMSLMHDHFDEIIANVDTKLLMDELPRNEPRESIDSTKKNEARTSKPGCSSELHSLSSNVERENNNLKSGRIDTPDILDTISEDCDRTLTSDNAFVKNDTSRRSNSTFGKKMSVELEAKKDSSKGVDCTSKKFLQANHSIGTSRKVMKSNAESDLAMYGVHFEYDSLMNITHDQIMLEEFKADLFGNMRNLAKESSESTPTAPSTSSDSAFGEPRVDLRTPRRTKRNSQSLNTRARKTTLLRALQTQRRKESNAEHGSTVNVCDFSRVSSNSGSVQAINSTARRNLTTSPVTPVSRGIHKQPEIISSSTGETSPNSSPMCKRIIQPLCQSTPKIHETSTESSSAVGTYLENKRGGRISNTSFLVGRMEVGNIARHLQKQPERQKLCFMCSGLVSAQIERVEKLALMFNGKFVSKFVPEVTHVIVSVNEKSNGANKTLKYLQGIAHRKWIVAYKWVIDSLKNMKLAKEDDYEALDADTLEAGPQRSRLRKTELFQDFAFICVQPCDDVSAEEYKDLLLSTGGTVVESFTALANEKKKFRVIVIKCAETCSFNVIKEWYNETRAVVIVHDWIVECISRYKLISFYPYLIELMPEDVLALGYPEYLIEEPEEDSDNSTCDT